MPLAIDRTYIVLKELSACKKLQQPSLRRVDATSAHDRIPSLCKSRPLGVGPFSAVLRLVHKLGSQPLGPHAPPLAADKGHRI